MRRELVPLFILAVIAGIVFVQTRNNARETDTPSQNQTHSTSQKAEQKTVTVEELGMTFSIPQSYYFDDQVEMNTSTNEPSALTFTVQNYRNNVTQVSDPYQLYGIYQWDTDTISEEQFLSSDFMLDETTREEFIVDGQPAVKGVTVGERARYTIFILKDGRMLSLAASGMEERQRSVTDAIIESIEFTN